MYASAVIHPGKLIDIFTTNPYYKGTAVVYPAFRRPERLQMHAISIVWVSCSACA